MNQRDSCAQGPGVLQVFLFRDGLFYGTECFAQESVELGRDEAADLRLEDEQVSRSHATLRQVPEGMLLEDLGSSNGTRVNGEPVEECLIDARDEISIGSFTLKVKQIGRKRSARTQDQTLIVPIDTPQEEATLVTESLESPSSPVREVAPFPEEPTRIEPSPRKSTPEDPLPEPVPIPFATSGSVEDREEDEEEVPRDFVEPFSLLNNLIRENFAQPPTPTRQDPVLEVIGYGPEKQVRHYEQVSRGRRFRMGAGKFVLAHYQKPATCRLMFTDDFSGGVIRAGQTVSIDSLKTSSHLVSKRRGRKVYSCELGQGDYANLVHEGGGSFLRFVNPPQLPPAPRKRQFEPRILKIFGSAFLAHVLFLVVLSLTSRGVSAASETDIDRFTRVDIKDIQFDPVQDAVEIPLDELPVPEQPDEQDAVEPEPEPKDVPEKPEHKRPSKVKKAGSKKGAGKGGDGGGGGVGMMDALANLDQKKSSHNIVAAVTNLDAVRVPGGRSRYRVSGLVTKMPTSSVVISRGRGVGVKAGIDLLRGGKGRRGRAGVGPGALTGGNTGHKKVGGLVIGVPKRRLKVRGHLSREAIAKVVRQHLREIQYCYEKSLLLKPNLQGKVIMEWHIDLSGSVSLVKNKLNTLATPAVAMCISAKIKNWHFPKPKGGKVVVSYPFIFNSIDF